MLFWSILIGSFGLVLALPAISDLASAFKGLAKRPKGEPPKRPSSPRFLIIVPAHNEHLLIEGCVQSLLNLDYPPNLFDLVVIADNCSDNTAELARAAGASCLERFDSAARGKPWALDWAFEQLPLSEYDAVLIVDADTIIHPQVAKAFAERTPLKNKAVQGFHCLRNPEDSPITQMAAVLATATYRFMFPLRARAGLNVPLTGNGMCIGTGILQSRGWRAFTIAEDTELYVDLTLSGYRIESEPSAIVYSQEARNLRQSRTQRQRWRAGRMEIARRTLLRILGSKRLGVHQRIDMLGELVAPGPVVQFAIVTGLTMLTLWGSPPGMWLLLGLLLVPVLRVSIYTVLAVVQQPRPMQSVTAFIYLPVYLMWRVWIELSSLNTDGVKTWIRTARHVDPKDNP